MRKNIVYIIGLLLAVSACDTLPDPEMEVASTYPVSGEWYVNEYHGDDPYGPYHVKIYNTSFGKDSVWITNIYEYGIVIKSQVTADNSFDIADAPNYSFSEDIPFSKATISNSKIIDGDSIYFEVVLYNADGDVADEFYTAGHRWTGLEGE